MPVTFLWVGFGVSVAWGSGVHAAAIYCGVVLGSAVFYLFSILPFIQFRDWPFAAKSVVIALIFFLLLRTSWWFFADYAK